MRHTTSSNSCPCSVHTRAATMLIGEAQITRTPILIAPRGLLVMHWTPRYQLDLLHMFTKVQKISAYYSCDWNQHMKGSVQGAPVASQCFLTPKCRCNMIEIRKGDFKRRLGCAPGGGRGLPRCPGSRGRCALNGSRASSAAALMRQPPEAPAPAQLPAISFFIRY